MSQMAAFRDDIGNSSQHRGRTQERLQAAKGIGRRQELRKGAGVSKCPLRLRERLASSPRIRGPWSAQELLAAQFSTQLCKSILCKTQKACLQEPAV